MGFAGREFAFDSPAAAIAAMIARIAPGATPDGVEARETCHLAATRGRVLAEAVAADRDNPAFDASAMDGYAVHLADVLRAGAGNDRVVLPVVGEVRIGGRPPVLSVGAAAAVRIVTGAAVPAGADTVIRREDVTEHAPPEGDRAAVSAISIPAGVTARVRAGDNIRRRGENAPAGEVVLGAGAILSAAALGTLATVGCVRPAVRPRVRVAVLTTGDELVRPEETPDEFQVRNSNGEVLRALLAARAWVEAADPRHVLDDGGALDSELRDAIADSDAVVITGGVSMGHRDPVRAAVETARAEIIFHGLPQRPGKPMLGAVARRGDGARIPVLGLPGNPVSAMVTCERFVIPLLAARAGIARWPDPPRIALANPDGRTLGLWWHRLVRLDRSGRAELLDTRGSGDVIASGRSDGFIEVPPNSEGMIDPMAVLYPFYSWPT